MAHPPPDDWRRQGQEVYLRGVVLAAAAWRTPRPGWDHDHCAFCWTKFATQPAPDVVTAGYCTAEREHWVCPACFEDFRGEFAWVVNDVTAG